MKKTIKTRLLAITLCLCMLAGLAPLSGPALAQPSEDPSGPDNAPAAEGYEAASSSGQNPLGGSRGTAMSQLYVGYMKATVSQSGEYAVYGAMPRLSADGAAISGSGLDASPASPKTAYQNLDSEAEGLSQTNYRSLQAASLDMGAGDRKAVLCESILLTGVKNGQKSSYLCVRTLVDSGQGYMPAHVKYINLARAKFTIDALETRALQGANAVAAGDYDGDGVDELAVYVPHFLEPFIQLFDIGEDGSITDGASILLNDLHAISDPIQFNYGFSGKNLPIVSLTTSGLARGTVAKDHLAVSACLPRSDVKGHKMHNQVPVFAVYEQNADNSMELVFFDNLDYVNYYMRFPAAVQGDINGSGVEELIIAGYADPWTEPTDYNLSDHPFEKLIVNLLTWDENDGVYRMAYTMPMEFTPAGGSKGLMEADNGCAMSAPVALAAAKLNESSESDFIFLEGAVLSFQESQDALTDQGEQLRLMGGSLETVLEMVIPSTGEVTVGQAVSGRFAEDRPDSEQIALIATDTYGDGVTVDSGIIWLWEENGSVRQYNTNLQYLNGENLDSRGTFLTLCRVGGPPDQNAPGANDAENRPSAGEEAGTPAGGELLNAQDAPGEFRIGYAVDGGINDPRNPDTYSLTVETPLYGAERKGYRFMGWYFVTNSGSIADVDDTKPIVSLPIRDRSGNLVEASVVTIKAVWEPIRYPITYHTPYATDNGNNPATYTVKERVELKKPLYHHNGLAAMFKGWYKDPDFTEEITEIPVGTTGPLSLYAKLELTSCYIYFAPLGGVYEGPNPYGEIPGTKVHISGATRQGFDCYEWSQESKIENGERVADFSDPTKKVKVQEQFSLDGNRINVLYAGWTPAAGQVELHWLDPADGTEFYFDYGVKGQKIDDPELDPVRCGYAFDGKWYKDRALTQPWDFKNDRVPADTADALTLYAGLTRRLGTQPEPGGLGGYSQRTLTDPPTRITLSGLLSSDASLAVEENGLHPGDDAGCDLLRRAGLMGNVLSLHRVTLSGGFQGRLQVSLPVTGRDGETLTVVHCLNGKLTLYDVTVRDGYATVQVEGGGVFAVMDGRYGPDLGTEMSFEDVSESDWFYEYVLYVYQNGLMNGTGAGRFSPDLATTRAMAATLLWRMEGCPKAEGENPFTDVEENQWYTQAVVWAADAGLVTGYGGGLFRPEEPVSRQDLALLFYRYAQNKDIAFSLDEDIDIFSYADAQEIEEYAVPAMRWACGTGLINGKDGNRLDPRGSATRAEVAAILTRFCKMRDS